MSWQRLSFRDGRIDDDGPYDGAPIHLFEPLRDWVNESFGGMKGSAADAQNGPRLAAAIRQGVGRGRSLTVHNLTYALYQDPDSILDAVDAVLHMDDIDEWRINRLNELLLLGGSIWQVAEGGRSLTRRVDATAAQSFGEASSPSDSASEELKQAWVCA